MAETEKQLTDSYYMGVALKRAEDAARSGEIPVGAIVVVEEKIFSAEGNLREATSDPTAHAEVNALRHAAQALEGWRLEQATLYVTAEPCLLCSGAIYLARVRRVVFGCVNPKGGALRFVAEHAKALGVNHTVTIASGIREMECAQLLRAFFAERRNRERRDGRVVEGA